MPKLPRLFCTILVLGLIAFPVIRAHAQPDTPPAPAVAPSPVQSDFKVLFEKISAKLKQGKQSEADLTDELKGFDDLIAKYPNANPDELATVLVMKARLYLEVFTNNEKGLAILKQIKATYPSSKIAQSLDQPIASIEGQINLESQFTIGKPFPSFAEQDLDGNLLSVDGHKGKVVLIDFWATWCGPCVAELPNVLAAYAKYHSKGFDIIGISLDDDRAKLTAFIKDKNVTWPQYFDGLGWKNKLGQQYGITSIPATFLIDRNGIIVGRNLRGDALGFKLATLLP